MFNKNDLKYQQAVSIIRTLKEVGYEAYLVGGCVRDALLGIEISDYDIATSCPIQEIPKIFSDAVYVGEAFGVSLIKMKSVIEEEVQAEILACGSDNLGNPISRFSKEKKKRKKNIYFQYDVATFRWEGIYEDGRRPKEYKVKAVSVEEDAKRRDFTINAMYYDPVGSCVCLLKENKDVYLDHDCSLLETKDKILDFVGGQKDLNNKIIRAVGNPRERFKEDKLRMLRAVRLLFQLNEVENPYMNLTFKIDEDTEKAIEELADELLPAVSYERIWQELDKASKYPRFNDFLGELSTLGLLEQFLPEVKKWSVIHWESVEDVVGVLPKNTPLLIKLMAILGTFEKEKVLEIVERFRLPKPNWLEN